MNSILNYLFALVEAEAILACQTVGLDAGLGIVHSDAKGRQSLALDVMEPIRPVVEAFVLDLVVERTFRKADFVETSDGHVRLRAPFTHRLGETLPSGVRDSHRSPRTSPMSSARSWLASTTRPPRSRVATSGTLKPL